MEEPGDLLEDNWFFGNLLHTKTRNTISRCYSDLTSSSCPHPTHPLPPVCSNQESSNVKKEKKSSSFSSRKQPPIAPRSLNRTPSLPNSMETQSFLIKDMNPSPHLRRVSPIATSEDESDQENEEEEEDQESEFRLGRLIRQASMNSLHTSNPSPKASKVMMMENMGKKPELGQEKIIISDVRKMERNRSKNNIKISGKKKNGGGAPVIPGGWVDKSSSEDMKAHIKFWARAVATNVRQECS